MPKSIPEEYLDLFQKPAFAHLATLMPDGTPQVTPVWVGYNGTHLLVNTVKGRQKDLNLRARPKVGIEILDPANPYRYLSVQGQVAEISEDGADADIDKLAKRYLGVDKYPWHTSTDTREIVKIRPEKVIAQSN